MKMLKSLFLLLLLFLGWAVFFVWPQLGSAPTERDLRPYAEKPYFKDGRFIPPKDMSVHSEKMTGSSGMMAFLLSAFFPEKLNLPRETLHADSFGTPAPLAVYWLGHSSFILEIGGKRLLTDPVLGNAAPIPFMFGRRADAPLKRSDIPQTDIVLISHNHYDHLERSTVRALKNTDAVFIVPAGLGRTLRGWGVKPQNIRELDWGDSFQTDNLTVTAVPASHYTGRSGWDKNKTHWNGYVLQSKDKRAYFSGDTGYKETFFKQIGQEYGPFDVALIEIDAWNEGWPNLHLFPHQAVRVAQETRAKEIIPAHWGVFNLAAHPWNESVKTTARLAQEQNVKFSTPKLGEKFLPGETVSSRWWE